MTENVWQMTSKVGFSAVDLMLVTMSIVLGLNYSVVKIGIVDIMPLNFGAFRFAIASVILLSLLWFRERNFSIPKGDLGRFVLIALVGNTLCQIFFVTGIAWTTASNSSIILATTPIFVVIFNLILGTEKVKKTVLGGVILSFIGISLIVFGGEKPLVLTDQSLLGDLLILFGTICWSTYTVLSKPLLKHCTPLKLTSLTMAIGTPLLLLLSIPSISTQKWSSVSTTGWLSLAYFSCLATAISYVIWYTGVNRIGSARTALYYNLITVIAIVIAWISLSESMTPIQIVGASMIIISLYLARR